ncbi:hypothetical protein OJF2_35160 [Aquisphaera giovannonii]|uniref:Plasmid stabilization system protein n=1 Tax=Aquisphaera giovannonii TaxID=406548 RepID=A0A5B9W4H3_9BACT|nr:hypothetical protein OJF2_35160 [Aquisphaera giovannonii]
MSYRVRLTAQAEADIDRIFDWLAGRTEGGRDAGMNRSGIRPSD